MKRLLTGLFICLLTFLVTPTQGDIVGGVDFIFGTPNIHLGFFPPSPLLDPGHILPLHGHIVHLHPGGFIHLHHFPRITPFPFFPTIVPSFFISSPPPLVVNPAPVVIIDTGRRRYPRREKQIEPEAPAEKKEVFKRESDYISFDRDDERIKVLWRGPSEGVRRVTFVLLDKDSRVIDLDRDTTPPYIGVFHQVEGAVSVRVTVDYEDGVKISSTVPLDKR